MKSISRIAILPLALLMVMSPALAGACSVCFGDAESPMAAGTRAGVIVLAVVVYTVLITILGIAAKFALVARRLEREKEQAK